MEDPVVLSKGICPVEHAWESFETGKVYFSNEQEDNSYSVYVNDIKLANKTENIEPTWKILMKHVDLEEPTSLGMSGLYSKRVYNK